MPTDIATIPAIVRLNAFAMRLPPEHRKELYKTAETFLCIGAMHGSLAGLMSGVGKKSKGDQQDEYVHYLSVKADESA